jgi:hypothetical protein
VTTIAADLALGLDPVLLAERTGLDPDPWQADVLRSSSGRMLLNASRQSGKSTTVALLSLHTAIYQPGSLCLMLSPSLRQSGELFRKSKDLLAAVDRVALDEETQLSLKMANGSRIVSLPGAESTVRGYSAVTLLCIDEASRVPDGLYMSVRPMLAVSGGRLVALSTPFGTRGWWYEAWRSDQAWERYEVPATQCPRISREFLEEERANMGEWWFDQEYGCRFLDAQSAAFRREDIAAAFSEEVETWTL